MYVAEDDDDINWSEITVCRKRLNPRAQQRVNWMSARGTGTVPSRDPFAGSELLRAEDPDLRP